MIVILLLAISAIVAILIAHHGLGAPAGSKCGIRRMYRAQRLRFVRQIPKRSNHPYH